jgi:hypothetical protein
MVNVLSPQGSIARLALGAVTSDRTVAAAIELQG